jgi:hypothetical protein
LTIGLRAAYLLDVEEKRPERRQPEDHNFGSLMMLAVTAGLFFAGRLGSNEIRIVSTAVARILETDWQRHVLASSGYLELGMFDDAALALEEIDTPRREPAMRS